MNRIGGKSNTGEGGEDQRAIAPSCAPVPAGRNGDTLASVIGRDRTSDSAGRRRQPALEDQAGRLGPLRRHRRSTWSADQIQIKMAQGAKPGEGGQLPGHKVVETSRKLRHSVPGVGLISPPPHHDIYSIEDLAQLIHDLKNVKPARRDLGQAVSEVGVGTVAAGVAKAKSDHVTISGHDGGTGASPVSSIKHAGSPWELGLAETQQTLVLNRSAAASPSGRRPDEDRPRRRDRRAARRRRVRLRHRAARRRGCIMMRKCHLNTCPVGVATQDPVLRASSPASPSTSVNYSSSSPRKRARSWRSSASARSTR